MKYSVLINENRKFLNLNYQTANLYNAYLKPIRQYDLLIYRNIC